MIESIAISPPNALNHHKMTAKAYLEMERKGLREFDGKYELYNQTLIFIAGASEAHNKIAGHILTILNNLIWQNDLDASASQSDMKVVSFVKHKNYFYPDIVFVNGQNKFDDRRKDVLVNPTLLIEVLSDETEGFDRNGKFESYKKIDSLKEYILVSQYERCVEHFYKNEVGEWVTGEVLARGELGLRSIPYALPLNMIYYRMPF